MNIKFQLILALIIIGVVPLYLAGQSETIIINSVKVFKKHTRPLVFFTHSKHEMLDEVSCRDCHHIFLDGKNILDPAADLIEGKMFVKCSDCHNTKSDLMQAYHRQCIDCHDKEVKAGKPTGPRTCGECHVKGAAVK